MTNEIGNMKACQFKYLVSHMILSTRITPAWLHNLHAIRFNGCQFINVLFMSDDAVQWYMVLSRS